MSEKLTKEEYLFIQKLLEITKTILEDYDRLHHLEVNGRKNTSDYDVALETLKFNLHLEENLYKKLEENMELVYKIQVYITPDYVPGLADELEIIKYESRNELVKLRINNRLCNIIDNEVVSEDNFLGSYDDTYDEFEDDLDDEIDEDIPKNMDDAVKKMEDYRDLDISIEKDFINSILFILNSYINNPRYSEYRDRLLRLKYNISFIYRSPEDYLVENYMDINDKLYIESKLTLDIQQRDSEELFKRIDGFKDDIIFSQNNDLFRLLTEEVEEDDKEFYIIVIKIFLRVCFMFGSVKEIKQFQKSTNYDFECAEIKTPLVDEIANELINHLPGDVESLNIIHLAPYLQ